MIVFERAGLVFIFNFHPTNSFADYRIGIEQSGTYKIVLNSDSAQYGGLERIDESTRFFTTAFEWNNRKNFTQIYSMLRVALFDCLCLHVLIIYSSYPNSDCISFGELVERMSWEPVGYALAIFQTFLHR